MLHPFSARRSFVSGCCLLLTVASVTAQVVEVPMVTLTTSTHIGPTDRRYDGAALVVDDCTVTIDGHHKFHSITVVGARAVLTHSRNFRAATQHGMHLEVVHSMTIGVGASIDVRGKGYAQYSGPGYHNSRDGCGHGGSGGLGRGGKRGGRPYGSVVRPTQLGSSLKFSTNHPVGTGGGAVRLVVGGRLVVDGSIMADAGSRGSAGGSIWIEADRVEGVGTIHADGFRGSHASVGAGGGGRISITARSFMIPRAKIFARGGLGNSANPGHPAGAGTVYLKAGSKRAVVYIDNGGRVTKGRLNAMTELTGENEVLDADVVVSGQAILGPIEQNQMFLRLTGDLTIAKDGRVSGGEGYGVTPKGRGYPFNTGPGKAFSGSGGGGYGGFGGGKGGGSPYGSKAFPTHFGSAGIHQRINWGTGAIRLRLGGDLVVEGTLSLHGNRCSSGGSLLVECNDVRGSGTITARGGQGWHYNCGGGGGGRVAFYTKKYPMTYPAANVSADGGKPHTGVKGGSPGTKFFAPALPRVGTLVGLPCKGARRPSIEAIGNTKPGESFLVTATGTDSRFNVLIIGKSSTQWGAIRLPISTTSIGLPSPCYLNVSIDSDQSIVVVGSALDGYRTHVHAVPSNAVRNTPLFFQWHLFSDSAGYLTTAGLKVTIR